ncbi:MAG: potassium transporter TrkH [Deltaproteobacteria bacterium]|nr:potassium transporter TrkH [Deltaproteobacteria bacterium]
MPSRPAPTAPTAALTSGPGPARTLFVRRAEAHGLGALLVLLAPLTLPLYQHLPVSADYNVQIAAYVIAALGGLGLAGGGALLLRPATQRLGRGLATVGALACLGLVLPSLLDRPERGFLAVLAGLTLLFRIWPDLSATSSQRTCTDAGARGAAKAALAAWALGAAAGWATNGPSALGVALSIGGSWLVIAKWALTARRQGRPVQRGVLVGMALGALGTGLTLAWQPGVAATLALLGPLSLLYWTNRAGDQDVLSVVWDEVSAHPARSMVATFAVLIGTGTLLLSLPVASARANPASVVDAMFTAVSASCVTGLAVLDTAKDWTPFGQVVIFGLFQVGGLGIMAFSSGATLLLGRRIGIKQELAMGDLLGADDGVVPALRRLFIYTLTVEGISAALLTAGFWAAGDAPSAALWRGLFTAVSAFCNAGFALQSDSLIGYNANPFILHVVALTIIFGGLGPVAALDLPRLLAPRLPGRWFSPLHRLRLRTLGQASLQSKLTLWTTAVLLVLPTLLWLGFEWEQTLVGLSIADKVHNAWFQSVTMRTAGFNSVDLAASVPATVVMMIVLMFIGGGPGSTAGGIKTTTAALLALALAAALRGDEQVRALGRTIPAVVIFRAIATITAATATVVGAITVLLLVQTIDPLIALYEVVSAVGTVGTSIGGTPLLDEVGKVLISACMFAGRVGPLTLFLLLPGRSGPKPLGLPEEEVAVG